MFNATNGICDGQKEGSGKDSESDILSWIFSDLFPILGIILVLLSFFGVSVGGIAFTVLVFDITIKSVTDVGQ